jgi:hypothetical protein
MKLAKRCIACDGIRLRREPAVLMPFVANRIFNWTPVRIEAEWGLRDLAGGNAYSLCNSVLCEDCEMLFLDMRFDDEEMAALYDDYRGEGYTAQRQRFEPDYGARNVLLLEGSDYNAVVEEFLKPYLPSRPRVLDWGGDTGVNTPFRSSATQHDVYDISRRPLVTGARAVNLQVAKSGEYDLIVFANVLEHISHPREALREIASAMRPATTLYLEVPHESLVREHEDPQKRLNHKHHWHEHINFFSSGALAALFRDVGLHVLKRKSHPIVAGGKENYAFSIAAKQIL